MKMMVLTIDQAALFYSGHKEKPFFVELTKFMCSGPVTGLELVSEDAVLRWRQLVGPK
jgi:nucleoside-diphosphate kinase